MQAVQAKMYICQLALYMLNLIHDITLLLLLLCKKILVFQVHFILYYADAEM